MNTAIFTPTRHPGIAPSYYSVMRQTVLPDYWLVADQLDRGDMLHKKMKDTPVELVYCNLPVKEGYVGNLAQVDNWALTVCRELEVELLIFLQDYIWAPYQGVEKFIADAENHPFSLLTGRCDASAGPLGPGDRTDPWSIFYADMCNKDKPYGPFTIDPRVNYGWKKGIVSSHAWEVNWGALPFQLINAGIDFDEDYDRGTQWENTQFSFDILRAFIRSNGSLQFVKGLGTVWWNPDNHAYGMPHREYFPKTHEGEIAQRNDQLFWHKNPDLKVGA